MPETGRDGRATPTSTAIEHADGELRLVVDGAVQSVAVNGDSEPRGYWRALLPHRRPRSALILGLGGGTIVHLLRRRFGGVAVMGVDNNPDVLRLARERFGIGADGTEVVEADARSFVSSCRTRFDLVVVDLFQGEVMADFVAQQAFIRRIRSLVSVGGTLVWNMHRDRRSAQLRRRAGAGLIAELRIIGGLNLVLHYRRRGRVRRSMEDPVDG